jgi:cytochrome oxidase assembly protein ShyY1
MTRRLPIVPSIIVALAVALMIGLGIWQLQRAEWKEGLLARYAAAQDLPPITWPTVPLRTDQLPLFRHATGVCLRPIGRRAIAGENLRGEPGYVLIVYCATGAEGPGMAVEVGWSRNPNAKVNWSGGPVSGIIIPDRISRMRLVAASSPPGLEPSRPPDVSSVSPITPAIHRGYAITWFGLAVVALIIYGLALRKGMKLERTAR